MKTVTLAVALLVGASQSASAGTVYFKHCSAPVMADVEVFNETGPSIASPTSSALAIRVDSQRTFTCDTARCVIVINYRVRTGWNQSAVGGEIKMSIPDGSLACMRPHPRVENDQVVEVGGSGCAC
jgi:hypothetical protein